MAPLAAQCMGLCIGLEVYFNVAGRNIMSKSKKKKQGEKLPDVLTAHRETAERRSGPDGDWKQPSDRPNGTSGNYS